MSFPNSLRDPAQGGGSGVVGSRGAHAGSGKGRIEGEGGKGYKIWIVETTELKMTEWKTVKMEADIGTICVSVKGEQGGTHRAPPPLPTPLLLLLHSAVCCTNSRLLKQSFAARQCYFEMKTIYAL